MLEEAGIHVEAHHEHFAPDSSDEAWIPEVARRGWVALSHDKRIRYKPNEQAAVLRSNARLLILVGQTTTASLATNFINTIGRVERFLERHRAPFIAKVYRATESDRERDPAAPGFVEVWLDGSSTR